MNQASFNSKDLDAHYGTIIESGLDQWLVMPELKEPAIYDYQDENGIDVDLTVRYFKAKRVRMYCALIADSFADYWNKYNALVQDLSAPGLIRFYVNEYKRGFYVYFERQAEFKGITNLENGTIGVKFALDFVEPEPTLTFTPGENPTVFPGENRTITLPTTGLTVSGAMADGMWGAMITATNWTSVSAPVVPTINGGDTLTPTFSSMTAPGEYVFRLTVEDSNGLSGSANMTVTVKAPAAPIVNAGTDRVITLPVTTVTIEGASITPRDGATITYRVWQLVSSPTFASIADAGTLTPTFAQMNVPGQYVFQLYVEDSNYQSAADELIVTVNETGSGIPYVLPIIL